MSNLLLSPDSCDPCNVHIRDIGQPPQRVYPPSFSGARKGTPGLGGGRSAPLQTTGLESKLSPCPSREHPVKAVPGRPVVQDLVSDLGEATGAPRPDPGPQFPQVHHPNPKFLSQSQGEDGGENLSLKACGKGDIFCPREPRSPAHSAQNETPTSSRAAVTLP